jgi:ribosome maturation factor RimP
MGSPVLVKLYRPQNGSKEFAGHLAGYNAETGDVTVTVGKEELTYVKKDVALVRLRVEF